MATYAVDSNRQPMVATGKVNPVMAWVENADGKRSRSKDAQEHDETTKLLLWAVEVNYDDNRFGDEVTVTTPVIVSAKDRPVIQRYTPITFHGLTVDAGVARSGRFFESWRARELDQFTPAQSEGKSAAKAAA